MSEYLYTAAEKQAVKEQGRALSVRDFDDAYHQLKANERMVVIYNNGLWDGARVIPADKAEGKADYQDLYDAYATGAYLTFKPYAVPANLLGGAAADPHEIPNMEFVAGDNPGIHITGLGKYQQANKLVPCNL